MEIIGTPRKWGNGSGILLPKEWFGKEVKVILIDRTGEIKKEVFSILTPYLQDILGIYLVGSYARHEQQEDSDIDIIVISKDTKKEIISGNYNISIIPLETIKNTIKKNPIIILPRILEANAILNKPLSDELKKSEIKKESFKEFIEDTKRIVKINQGLLDLDKKENSLKSLGVIYSLMLRLRGLFLAKCLLSKKLYSNKSFKSWILNEIPDFEYELIYKIYKEIKIGQKPKKNLINLESIQTLSDLLKKEINKW